MPGRLSFPVGAGQRYLRRLLRRQGASRYLPVCYPLRHAFAFVQPWLPHGLGRRDTARYLSMLFLQTGLPEGRNHLNALAAFVRLCQPGALPRCTAAGSALPDNTPIIRPCTPLMTEYVPATCYRLRNPCQYHPAARSAFSLLSEVCHRALEKNAAATRQYAV